jgi:hypothetical protein
MSNQKTGCARCKRQSKRIEITLNFRPFMRLAKKYHDHEITREAFVEKWGKAQEGVFDVISEEEYKREKN